MKKTSVKVNFGYNLIYNILNIIIPLITAPYTARVLGAEKIGIYSYTYSIVSSMIMFGALGTSTYGQREIAYAGEDKKIRSQKFWEIWSLKAICMMTALLIFLCVTWFSEDRYYFLLEIPFFIAGIFEISFLFQGIEQFKYIAIRNCLVRIVGVILLFALVKDQNDLWIYLLIIGVSQLAGNLSMWPYIKQHVVRVSISPKGIFKHTKNVLVYFIPSITYQIYAVLDKAMLGWLVGSNYENGYYEQAHKIVNLVVSVISAYTVVMRSRMSALYSKKNMVEIHDNLKKSYNVIALLVFPMTFGLAAIAAGMVPWFFGEGYDPVIQLLYVFCPVFIFMGYSRLIGTHILTPSGRQMKSNNAQILAAVVNMILNAIFIPRLFSLGAAIASVMAEIVIMVVYFFMVRDEISFLEMLKVGWKKLISAIAMFAVIYPLSGLQSPSVWWSFIQVISGTIIYVAVLLLLRDAFLWAFLKEIITKVKGKDKNGNN